MDKAAFIEHSAKDLVHSQQLVKFVVIKVQL